MPTLKRSPFKPNEIVVSHTSAGGLFGVGTRLRGDHPHVLRCPWAFAKDGTPTDELARLRIALELEAQPQPVQEPARTMIAKEVRDEDAVVATRGMLAGTRVHRKSRAALDAPAGTYVPVMPDKTLDRRDALVAVETLRMIGEDGKPTRVLYGGQLAHRDDPLVRIHPHLFTLPQFQDDREV